MSWKSKLALLLVVGLLSACAYSSPTDGICFLPRSIPKAQVGVPYNVEIRVLGGVTPVGGFEIEPQLPVGLIYTAKKGRNATLTIKGIPEKAGKIDIKIVVWCYGTVAPGRTGNIIYHLHILEKRDAAIPADLVTGS